MPSPYVNTLPLGGAESLLDERLAEARGRTLHLIQSISVEDLERVHSRLMSPLVWDLGHIAAFEDLWICHRLGGLEPLRADLMEVYDAAETPRAGRGELPYLRHREALGYLDAVRRRALRVLTQKGTSPIGEMVLQHEHQHNETMLQTMQLAEPGTVSPPWPPRTQMALERVQRMVRVEAGAFTMGDDGTRFAYDNERPQHQVDLPAFDVDRLPVSNGDYLEFVRDGGYERRELWSPGGWAWRSDEHVARPLYWTSDGRERRFDRVEPIDRNMPVMHVSWFEADAFARWAGKRLPTEAEWEKAAARTRAQPGTCNVDQLAFGPLPVGAFPRGASAHGVLGMIGDAWEWTAGEFGGYPGFRPYPYREYSEVFFGEGYKVLRGGSWATRPSVARNTFRNWDLPQRRQIFCGFRCARDA
jgi:gamma-glutamyl hercynylcysteine S-oxide synthase